MVKVPNLIAQKVNFTTIEERAVFITPETKTVFKITNGASNNSKKRLKEIKEFKEPM